MLSLRDTNDNRPLNVACLSARDTWTSTSCVDLPRWSWYCPSRFLLLRRALLVVRPFLSYSIRCRPSDCGPTSSWCRLYQLYAWHKLVVERCTTRQPLHRRLCRLFATLQHQITDGRDYATIVSGSRLVPPRLNDVARSTLADLCSGIQEPGTGSIDSGQRSQHSGTDWEVCG